MIAAAAIATVTIATPHAQSNDPTAQPRLTADSLTYMGGFRMPNTANGDTFEFGGRQLTFNPYSNSLFIGSRSGRIAEVSIPGYVNSANPAAMPRANYLQAFVDPTEGHLGEVGVDGAALDGLLVYNNKLYGSASLYYDALNSQRISHYSHSLQLNVPSFSGWSSVWNASKTGMVSGFMSLIPTEWQALLGGPAATGQCCIPVVSRTSYGPAAFAFNPAQLGQGTAPAAPLLYYSSDHQTLGPWMGQNDTYGSTTFMGGMAIIAGTRTALYLGRNGLGPNCYGNGTADQSLAGTIAADGAHYCYDPASNDKGTHAYPYRYQIWAYDLKDFAAVKAGTKQPWEITPYGVWPLTLPTAEPQTRLGGVGYDPVHQLLYVSQLYADQDGYAFRPIVHVIQINATSGSNDSQTISSDSTSSPAPAPTPAPAPAPAPAASTVVNAITMSANRVAPQLAGTAITFSAFATGSGVTQEYKWLVDDGTGFKPATNWAASDTFTWTPQSANANYRVGVWARNNSGALDAPESSASTRFAITAPAAVPVRSVTFAPDKAAPQPAGASITFTATVDGGRAIEYKWLLHDGVSWGAVTGWSSQNSYVWTPASGNPSARIGLWVRSNGNTNDAPEETFSIDFPISAAPVAATPAPTPVPTPSSGPVRSVTFASNKTAPQPQGSTIVFTAAVDGGSAIQYRWLVHDGLNWSLVTGWSSQNTFAWTPASANASARIGIWVRSNGSTSDDPEATWSADFPVGAAPAAPVIAASVASVMPIAIPAPLAPPIPAPLDAPVAAPLAATVAAPPAPMAGPAVTVTSTTVQPGAAIQFTVSGGPRNARDWVALSRASAVDGSHLLWMYLNGSNVVPVERMSGATLQFIAPSAPGTYDIRFFANDGLTKLASSETITVAGASSAPVPSASGPAVTVALTTVKPGAAIQFTVSGGPANARDWVSLSPVSAADSNYLTWSYLSGSNVPTIGTTTATLQFKAPLATGTYNVRFFANDGFTKLGTSATITVAP
ncbi:MAG TPA: hypothetical protein VM096_07840 [Vicinamibacterales bacterium]|nr:hypothetical protein [Vicinamibacterales bacterium]